MSENNEHTHFSPSTADLAGDGQAAAYLERHGADTVEHAFAIANILHIHNKVLEASAFYRHAFDLHSKSQTEYPLPQSLLQVRLLCLLKAAQKLPEEEINELSTYSPVMAGYIRGIRAAWQENNNEKSLALVGNAFEAFHSGEEIDRLYLEIALNWIRSFGDSGFPDSEPAIPHHLYMYWDNNPPPEIQANIQLHREMLGDSFTIFDQSSAADWLYDHYGQEAKDLFLQVRHPAEGADLLRLHVILTHGGWWLDADLRVKSPQAWQELKDVKTHCQLFTTDNYVLHNDFFGAAPTNPIITNALMTAWANMFRHPGLYIAFKTGPGVLNRAVSRALYQSLQLEALLPAMRVDNQPAFDRFVEEYEVQYKNAGASWHSQ
ncbi:hypothetical protein AA106555_0123 [Neokomagataea thailandica NBRC 106555]|uniref:Mannosyltransferase n=2 Tax=Neokomagataea TaxID=1223423 RepID=A0A4Y6V8K5_9PROT|nr:MULTISPECIES: hypothetical protein [Neokomagataea]QDH24866.1 hypothetical protein D5366_06140 [Neokomagataea tanensis]GBR50192.1 hypothetical protein AA106555_0123 [Neokomagataea thailandica NBRC 106555]